MRTNLFPSYCINSQSYPGSILLRNVGKLAKLWNSQTGNTTIQSALVILLSLFLWLPSSSLFSSYNLSYLFYFHYFQFFLSTCVWLYIYSIYPLICIFASLLCFVTDMIFFTASNCKYNGHSLKCKETKGKICNRFLPALHKDLHDLCVMCHGLSYSLTLWSEHCAPWSANEWAQAQAYSEELQRQHKRKIERKSKFSSSFTGFDHDDQILRYWSEYLANVTYKIHVRVGCSVCDLD